ncbi:4'-phosphopantetheinyl transferase family protein [Actinomyces qiguomingii]|uniref:4'-phosphopantetheinyl transferase family protein n=1 Tax=Actinomyces qiguomingii TaxID=2057800 RepID=UPI000CA00FE0|nr:4'-phosphopantetheinyl transferase superfamily protein [Actinomyces qiguomingii]
MSQQAQWLRLLLPPSVAVVETRQERPYPLYPQEQAFIAGAVAGRIREFTTVRWCADRALHDIGHRRPAQVPGPAGEPSWPPGVVGSMTHCRGYRAAAVAMASDLDSIGIDAEPDAALPAGVLEHVASAREKHLCERLASWSPGVSFDRLLFSIKECVFKAWFPCEGTWLDFEDAEVTISCDGRFTVCVRRSGNGLGPLSGRWLAERGLLVAALAVPSGDWERARAGQDR